MLQNKVIEYRDRILTIIADIVNKKSSRVGHSYHRVFDFIYRLIEIKFSITGGRYNGDQDEDVIDKLLLDLELIKVIGSGQPLNLCSPSNKGNILINCIFLDSEQHNFGYATLLNEYDATDDIIMSQLCLNRLRLSLEFEFPTEEKFAPQAL